PGYPLGSRRAPPCRLPQSDESKAGFTAPLPYWSPNMAHSPLRQRLAIESLEDRTVPSTVSGSVFNDINGNGLRDAGEAGIGGAGVYLDLTGDNIADAGEPAAVTAADGTYTFADAPTGTYAVRQLGSPGFTQTSTNPNPITVTVGATLAGGDFG